jgi:catechol 2,3-dioxygenase-like lactoylglutathione lyase family enzyme
VKQSIGLVSLVVPEYDEAIAFYVGVLGFTLVEDVFLPAESKRWVVVAPPGSTESRLLLARASSPEQASRIGNQTGGRVFLFLYTDDFARDSRRYTEKGVTFVRGPKEESYGTVAVFRDPWGNLWDLIQPRSARALMHDVQHVTVYIARRPAEVYEFASDPRNLPRWAAGLARSEVRKDGDEWVAEAPFGKIRVRFAPKNSLGVMDHDVRLESGATIHNPMRVVPNGEGSELVFTLIRRPGMSDAELAKDETAVESDLKTLKGLLEGKAATP